ncbi:MAG: VIT1/CCC1 transporter family protein [Patescibacteria group bacterium]|mgnify:FL=1
MKVDKDLIEEHGMVSNYGYVADFVYGGIDGAVTTFAVVAGVVGAELSLPIILILGFANLFADGFSMSVGKYLSEKTMLEQYNKIRSIEFRHLKEKEKKERSEVVEILTDYGFKGNDLERAAEIITSNPEAWVDIMMKNEFNVADENINPIKGAIATFISFIVVGFIPLLGYTGKAFLPFTDNQVFIFSAILTLVALFVVGAVKSKFSLRNWFVSGLETALIGGFAALIAYLIGFFLKGIAG